MDESAPALDVAQLVKAHYRLVYRYAYRLTGSAADAEDLTQQTFLTAQTNLNQLRDADRAAGWLCAIARTTWLKSLRGRRGQPTIALDHVPEPADDSLPSPADLDIDPEELQRALMELPEEFRSTLILFYFEDFSYRDIAEHTDVPIGTVMSRLARAKRHLRARLEASAATPAAP